MTVNSLSARAREKLRVLVIDDDELAREFLCDILRREGFNVIDWSSTIGVTNKIVREGIRVVVIDVMMPTIRGDRLASLLRKNSALGALGVVLVSSCPREELEQLAKEVGAQAIVGKQDARTQLVAAVMHAARTSSTPSGSPGPGLEY